MADAGRIVIIPKGEYKSNITYERLDAVEYNNNGYIALKTVTGITPTNDGMNWALYVKGTPVDSELSATSTNAVQNKIVTAEISALRKETTVNLLNPTLQTTTQNGITITNNGDGTYTLNGTATNKTFFNVVNFYEMKGKKYKLTGCPLNGSYSNTYALYFDDVSSGLKRIDEGNGIIFTATGTIERQIYIVVREKTIINNLVFKPMLTTNLSATYDDFVPYTGDTGSLNGDMASLLKRIQALESQFASSTSELCSDAIDDLASVVSTQDEAIDELATIVTESEEK